MVVIIVTSVLEAVFRSLLEQINTLSLSNNVMIRMFGELSAKATHSGWSSMEQGVSDKISSTFCQIKFCQSFCYKSGYCQDFVNACDILIFI